MFVIGRNKFDFVKVTYCPTLYDGEHMWKEIFNLQYEAQPV